MKKVVISALSVLVSTTAIFAQTDTTSVNNNDSDTTFKKEEIPQFSTSLNVLDEQAENQDVSGLLQSSRDVFTSIAGFNFSAARYRIRGYDSENFVTMMNGVTLNNPESGRAIWAYWGGLNDITRYQEVKNGIASSPLTFGGIGGFSNIGARASEQRPGTRFSYSTANRSYRHRAMLTHSTGMMSNGMAVTLSGSVRYANEGFVEGTYYRSGSYFLSVEKKINEKHSLGLVAFGAPTVSGGQSISVQEAYDLTGDNQYNSYWGMQNGEKRNSRVRNTHIPMGMLNHYFTINSRAKVQTSAYFSSGRNGRTRLNWYDAADPRPDYYRNLPSYYSNPGDESMQALLTEMWQTDVNTQQLDFDQMFFANTKNLHTVEDANGIAGNDVTGNRAKYMIEEERQDQTRYGLNSTFSLQHTENLLLSGGINIDLYKSKNFKVMDDLLGADYWVDVDRFAERDFADESVAQSNVDIPNHIIQEGDKFGFDYDININNYNTFFQADGKSAKVDWFAGISLGQTSFWRTGNVKNGLFQENSIGDSEKQNFFNYGIKAGAVYKVTGRHLVAANAAYLTRAPQTRNSFVSPRTRNEIVNNLEQEKIMSADLNYLIRYPNVKVRLTGFYTKVSDKTWARSFYHEDLNTFVNYIMTGVDQNFMGIEMGAEVKLNASFDLTTAFTTGSYTYSSQPSVTISQDNSTELLAQNRKVYFENYRIGGMPQTAASIGIKYNSSKYWFAGVNFNYFADIYLDANPDRRTEEAIEGFVDADPQVEKILAQTKLDNGYTLNLFAGKSWKIKEYFIRVNVNINNILDEKELATGGFEQLRYDSQNIDRFPPKIGYMYGRTYFAMVSFLF